MNWMSRRTTALAAALSVLALGSPLMTGCGAQTTIAEGGSNEASDINRIVVAESDSAERPALNDEIAELTELIESNPQDADAYNNRGLAKYLLNDYQGAIADCSKAIEINPQLAIAYSNRGIAKYSLNRFQGICVDCCSDWKKALSLGNETTERMFADPKLDLGWCRNMR